MGEFINMGSVKIATKAIVLVCTCTNVGENRLVVGMKITGLGSICKHLYLSNV